jgi:hypothetical protein
LHSTGGGLVVTWNLLLAMRLRFAHAAALAALTAASTAGAPACTPSNGNGVDASLDHLPIVPGGEAGGDDGGGDAQTGTQTTISLANMSPDLGAVDFCWRVSGSAMFTGPVLGGSLDGGTSPGGETEEGGAVDAAADASGAEDASDATEPPDATLEAGSPADGAAADATADAAPTSDAGDAAASSDAAVPDAATPQPPVAFASLSAAVTLPASGTIDIALVAAGQLSCGSPVAIGTVTLDAGKITTVAVMGLAGAEAGSDSALSLVAFTDELSDATVAKVRFVHAALGWPDASGAVPAPSLSARAGPVVLAPEVDPRHATTPATMPPVDPLGFASVMPVSGFTVLTLSTLGDGGAARAWSTGFVGIDALPGTVHTGFIVSLREGALGVAWCGVGPTVGVPTCRLWPAQ